MSFVYCRGTSGACKLARERDGGYLLEEVKPLWVKLDLNGDGYVTQDELCAEDPLLVSGFKKADYDIFFA